MVAAIPSGTMTADQFAFWIKDLFPTQQEAASAIGISLTALKDYKAGRDPIPLKIELACVAISLGYFSFADCVEKQTKIMVDAFEKRNITIL